jgi:hypothetical protein
VVYCAKIYEGAKGDLKSLRGKVSEDMVQSIWLSSHLVRLFFLLAFSNLSGKP